LQGGRLKALERENGRLKKAVADLTLDQLILKKGQVIIERRRQEYNIYRLHSSLGYHPLAPEAVLTPSEMTLESWLIGKELNIQIVQRLT